jgi:2-keto-3-deoxy-L-rhamnonate aldolase RhmA
VRLLAAAGLDYVVIDLQHGGAVEADLPAMTDAIRLPTFTRGIGPSAQCGGTWCRSYCWFA